MSNRVERVRCFYCGDPVAPGRLERDHFPVPAICGGTQTVPACVQCHDLKDRTGWETIPVEFKGAFMEEFARMGRAGKIVFAQFMREALQSKARRETPVVPLPPWQVGDRLWIDDETPVEIHDITEEPSGQKNYHLRKLQRPE
jgi:hypothetical protein